MSETTKYSNHLRVGVLGIGIGASSLLRSIAAAPFASLAAGADTNGDVLGRFSETFPTARCYNDAAALCRDSDIDVVWISTPTALHAEHAILAANHGKHVAVSKPLTTSLDDGLHMLEAADRAGVVLMAGHSLGFSPAIRRMAGMAQPGSPVGAAKAIQLQSFTDWVLLPRNPEELDVTRGGGLTDRQSPHQIDAARVLGGGMVESVSGYSAAWMPERPIPGFYAAFLRFENGALATLSHNGYGYLAGSELVGWGKDLGISGQNLSQRNLSRERIRRGENEQAAKHDQRLGGSNPLFSGVSERKPWMPMHLGLTVVSCEHGALRNSPFGVFVYSDTGVEDVEVLDDGNWFGASEIAELYEYLRFGKPLVRDAAWGLATLEVTCALKESHRIGREVRLHHQVPIRPGAAMYSSDTKTFTSA